MEQRGRDLMDLWESSFSEEQDQITELEAVLWMKKLLLGLRLGYRPRFWHRLEFVPAYIQVVLQCQVTYPNGLLVWHRGRYGHADQTPLCGIQDTLKVNQTLGLVSWIESVLDEEDRTDNVLYVLPLSQFQDNRTKP